MSATKKKSKKNMNANGLRKPRQERIAINPLYGRLNEGDHAYLGGIPANSLKLISEGRGGATDGYNLLLRVLTGKFIAEKTYTEEARVAFTTGYTLVRAIFEREINKPDGSWSCSTGEKEEIEILLEAVTEMMSGARRAEYTQQGMRAYSVLKSLTDRYDRIVYKIPKKANGFVRDLTGAAKAVIEQSNQPPVTT